MVTVARKSVPSDEFVAYLCREMEHRGWTPAELAREANLTQATVSRNLSGERNPSPSTVRAYAAALAVSEDYLLELAGHRTPRNRLAPPDLQAVLDILESDWSSYSEDRRQIIRDVIRRRPRGSQ